MGKIADKLEELKPLLRMITIKQVIEKGDKAIDACGLNPWCLKEGLAEGHEPALSSWKIDSLIEEIKKLEDQAESQSEGKVSVEDGPE